MMALQILCALLFILLPTGILKARHWKVVSLLGPVVVAYGVGIVLGQVLPETVQPVIKSLSEAAVPLSIPLLLFSQNPRTAFAGAGRMLGCFLLAAVGVSLSATLVSAYWAMSATRIESFPEFWQVAGMLVGTYTGGTPNMASIGLALDVPERIFLMSTAADTVLGGVYLMILVSVAQPLLRYVLPAYKPESTYESTPESQREPERGHASEVKAESVETTETAEHVILWKDVAKSLGLSVLIAALSLGGAVLLTGTLSVPVIMMLLTALALAFACIPRVNHWSGSYATGEYLILIFCLAIGAMIRFDAFMWENLYLFVFATAVMILGILVHLIFSRLFKLDRAHFLIASTAAVFGPPFVGVVARAINAPKLVASGLAVGVLGYALGNYLGLMMAYALQWLLI